MKHIFLNLKRFDIPKELGGVNSIAPTKVWGEYIINNIQDGLKKYSNENIEFIVYMPEAYIIQSINALKATSNISIGSQGVYRYDVEKHGNFGAFTTNRTASAIKSMGCKATIIGHCEERNDLFGIMKEAGKADKAAINRILNEEVKAAIAQGIKVLYCVGESSDEQSNWQQVLKEQIEIGLKDVEKKDVVIAYEPIWAIGPGKLFPDKSYITKIATYIKEISGGTDVVYGGGLKVDNAKMIASIPQISGGLIALTRFKGEIGFYPDEYLEIIKNYIGY